MKYIDKQIQLKKSTLLLQSDENSSRGTIVLFIPGISGKAFSDRFQPLVDVCLQSELPIARMNAWDSSDEVVTHSWAYFQEAICEVTTHLEVLGYKKIIAVGKSFGGGLLLSIHNESLKNKILWAPAVGVGDSNTLDRLKDRVLSNISSLLDIKLSRSFINKDTAKITIIHGTKDDTIPLENSEKVINSAKNGLQKMERL